LVHRPDVCHIDQFVADIASDAPARHDKILRAGWVLNCPPYGFWNTLRCAWQARLCVRLKGAVFGCVR